MQERVMEGLTLREVQKVSPRAQVGHMHREVWPSPGVHSQPPGSQRECENRCPVENLQ